MFNALVVSAVSLAPVAQIADAPDRLISPHGVELTSDGRVFVMFAALNALGYQEESKRKGPPLDAPVYHPIRVQAIDGMRKATTDGKLAAMRKLFDDHPVQIEKYLAAILSHDLGMERAEGQVPADAAALAGPTAEALKKLGGDPELVKLFDAIAGLQRQHAKTLMDAIEIDFAETEKFLGVKDLRAPIRLVVIPNPLDSHGSVRKVKLPAADYLVVGPGVTGARDAVLEAVLRPAAEKWAKAAWPDAKLLKKHWDGLKISKRITERHPDGESYLADTLTGVLAFTIRARTENKSSPAEQEDFIDRQSKDGMRWTRAVLATLESYTPAEGADVAIPKALAKANP